MPRAGAGGDITEGFEGMEENGYYERRIFRDFRSWMVLGFWIG
jgi:hypothetical protein